MKTLLLTVLMVMALFGCQERVKKIEPSGSSDPSGSEIYQKSKINFDSNRIAERYRTILSEKYNELDSNFATYYIILLWMFLLYCV